jgi:hypothetical protein
MSIAQRYEEEICQNLIRYCIVVEKLMQQQASVHQNEIYVTLLKSSPPKREMSNRLTKITVIQLGKALREVHDPPLL